MIDFGAAVSVSVLCYTSPTVTQAPPCVTKRMTSLAARLTPRAAALYQHGWATLVQTVKEKILKLCKKSIDNSIEIAIL